MLAIILGILKIIGMLVLLILGAVFTLLLSILLVPIRYRAQGSYYGELKGCAGASWLLHILSVQISYEGSLNLCFRVFGIRIGKKSEDWSDTKKTGKKKRRRDCAIVYEYEPDEQETAVEDVTSGERPEEKGSAEVQQNEKKAKTAGTKKQGFTPKIKVTFRRICDKLKALKDKKDTIQDFINNETNRRTLRIIKKQIVRLLKHTLPRKIRGKLRFGFDDPYTTGQILMYVSPFYGWYARSFQLVPVFNEAALDGELRLAGHIRIGTILMVGMRVLIDKNIRELLKKWREA